MVAGRSPAQARTFARKEGGGGVLGVVGCGVLTPLSLGLGLGRVQGLPY